MLSETKSLFSGKKEKLVSGVVIPMLTPINEKGEIDLFSVEKMIDNFIGNGIYPFLLGTTGEGTSVKYCERKKFIQFVAKKYSGKTKIYVNVGNNCVSETLENSKEFSDLGADFIVSVLPSYYALTSNQMLKYYESLAEASPKPILIYNITSTTHLSIPLDIVEKLSHHPNIAGLKDSERDIERFNNAIDTYKDREDFSHMVGWGAKSFYSLAKGSDGLVPSTGNFSPGMFKEMYDSVRKGDLKNGERMQIETDELAKVYQKDRTLGQSLAAVKVIMKYFNLCESYMLPPLTRLTADEEKSIIKNIEQLKERIMIY